MNRTEKLKLYYWQDTINFGDLLTPLLFERVLGTPVTHAPAHLADVISLGSLLQALHVEKRSLRHQLYKRPLLLCERRTLDVWGTGTLHDRFWHICARPLRLHALRGQKTKQIFSPHHDVPLGDPGLIANRLAEGTVTKDFRVGIIPHFSDKNSIALRWVREHMPDALIIEPQRMPMDVIADIKRCEYILSSSLHGLVVADSFGIPNRWVMFGDTSRAEERWKYEDYYSVFDIPVPTPWMIPSENPQQLAQYESAIQPYARPGLVDVQDGITASFPF